MSYIIHEDFTKPSDGTKSKYWNYLPHTTITTAVVAVSPVWLTVWFLNLGVIASTLVALAISLLLGAIGVAVWQRLDGCRDLVFDDLLLWKFLKRIRNERTMADLAERLSGSLQGRQLSKEERRNLLKKLAAGLEQGDPFTHGHSQRVARHAAMTAKELRLDQRTREKVALAALLHDVGKLEIPREILHKPDRLTDDEFEIVKTHPGTGGEMVSIFEDAELTAMVRSHHERVDGTGYPDGLSGSSIPLGARIIAVADTFDAITSRRPYRQARKHRVAIEILEREAGTQLDGDVVKAFLAYYKGRRSISIWSLASNLVRTGPGSAFESVGRAIPRLANALVVGGTSAALSLTPLRDPVRTPSDPSANMSFADPRPANGQVDLGWQDGDGNEGDRDRSPEDVPALIPPTPEPETQAPVVPVAAPPPEDPVVEETPSEEPPADEPPAHQPPTQEPPVTQPPSEEPPVEEPPAEEPPVEEPPAEEPPVEEPPAEEPPVEEPPAEEPPVEEPPAEEPPVEEPPAEEPPAEEPPNDDDEEPPNDDDEEPPNDDDDDEEPPDEPPPGDPPNDDSDGDETPPDDPPPAVDTSLDLWVESGGSSSHYLVVVLTDDYGAPLGGQLIDFFVNGNHIGSATTDPSGEAQVLLPDDSSGSQDYFASFAGDSTHDPSSASE
jgi:HD-GYP domain-containing protein (c-di-GMP phosphodiesterase class II)